MSGLLFNRALLIFGVVLSYSFSELVLYLKEKTRIIEKHIMELVFLIFIALIVRLSLVFIPITNVFSKIPLWEQHLFWGLFSGFLAVCISLLLKIFAQKIYHIAEEAFTNNIEGANINTQQILEKLEDEKRFEIKKDDVEKYLSVLVEKFTSSMKPEIKNFITMKEAFIICFLGTFLVVCVLAVMGVLAWISMYISLKALLLVIAGGSLIIILIFLSLGFYIGKLTEKGFLNGIIETLKYLRSFKINFLHKKSSESEDDTKTII